MNKQRRLTIQRRVVYEEVLSRCDHPTADQIYKSIHTTYPRISKSTVYRNLDILSKEGKINLISFPSGNRYDLTLEKHYHVICKNCGKVVDVDLPYVEELDKNVSSKSGFKITKHSMIFEGLCTECYKMKEK